VWCPKYRKKLLVGAIGDRVKELFHKVAEEFDFEIDSCEVAEEHTHMLLSFPPIYSISKVVAIIRSISSSKIFEAFLAIRTKLWGGHLWEQGYFVQTAGEQVTDDVIKRYIKKHSSSCDQPTLWESQRSSDLWSESFTSMPATKGLYILHLFQITYPQFVVTRRLPAAVHHKHQPAQPHRSHS